MSDSKCEFRPSAWATAGMIKASGGGVFFGVFATGATRLTETLELDDVGPPAFVPRRPLTEEPPLKATVTAPVFVPTPRPVVAAVTVIVMPLAGRVPVVGLTVSQGWSVV